jgi:hypothetical protein
MRTAMKPGLGQKADAEGMSRDPREIARERVRWILENHEPEPLENAKQDELARILAAADRELASGGARGQAPGGARGQG